MKEYVFGPRKVSHNGHQGIITIPTSLTPKLLGKKVLVRVIIIDY